MIRIEREKTTVEHMIRLYCRRQEESETLCPDCRRLLDYALKRLDMCRYGDGKGACKNCPAHCYSPGYRKKIREVMRYSGPRMLLFHPLETIKYWLPRSGAFEPESGFISGK